jgi:hypothetical protein
MLFMYFMEGRQIFSLFRPLLLRTPQLHDHAAPAENCYKREIYAAMFFFHNFHINIPNAPTINSVKTITTQNAEEWKAAEFMARAPTPRANENLLCNFSMTAALNTKHHRELCSLRGRDESDERARKLKLINFVRAWTRITQHSI